MIRSTRKGGSLLTRFSFLVPRRFLAAPLGVGPGQILGVLGFQLAFPLEALAPVIGHQVGNE